MQYKTMALQLLEQHPQMHDRLRSQRMLLPAVDRCAQALKASHEAWKEQLSLTRPGSDASQITSEALEIALKELEAGLDSGPPPPDDESTTLSLEAAMAFIRRHTPPA